MMRQNTYAESLREEDREKVEMKGTVQVITNCLKLEFSIDQIAKIVDCDVTMVETIKGFLIEGKNVENITNILLG